MKQFNTALFFMIVLVSCAPSEGVIQTTISRTQTALPTVTTELTVTPSGTSEPSQTPTKLPSLTPTVTPTFTPIPASSILLQEDFEDNKANGWVASESEWIVERETNGNHYLSLSGAKDYPQIWYGQNGNWTDCAFESRVKFVEGRRFNMWVHANGNFGFYALDINSDIVSFAQYEYDNLTTNKIWTPLGKTMPYSFAQNTWYTFRVEIKRDLISVYIDNVFVLEQKLPNPLIYEKGGVGYLINGGEKFYFDDIKVWSLK